MKLLSLLSAFLIMLLSFSCASSRAKAPSKISEPDLMGVWMMDAQYVRALGLDPFVNGVPLIRFLPDGRVEVKDFPVSLKAMTPQTVLQGGGKWVLRNDFGSVE